MSSNNNYYEFKDAKVAIAMELVKRGWKLYGFHEDESDWMTDYWSPAWWEGIATKDGFVVVVDCRIQKNPHAHQVHPQEQKGHENAFTPHCFLLSA